MIEIIVGAVLIFIGLLGLHRVYQEYRWWRGIEDDPPMSEADLDAILFQDEDRYPH